MADKLHPMERRSNMLAEQLDKRITMMADLMRPDGRPIYHQRVPEDEAVRFWKKHRYDNLGQSVLSTWTPDQILQLDLRLSQLNEVEGNDGLPA